MTSNAWTRHRGKKKSLVSCNIGQQEINEKINRCLAERLRKPLCAQITPHDKEARPSEELLREAQHVASSYQWMAPLFSGHSSPSATESGMGEKKTANITLADFLKM